MPHSSNKLRIVVTGLIAQHPFLGGVAWDYLQYVIGLDRLGHDVYYLEDSGEWPYLLTKPNPDGSWTAYEPSANLDYLHNLLKRFGLSGRWMYRYPVKPRWFGMSHAQRREILTTADLLINVSGTLRRPELYRSIHRLAYIDSDPGFTQARLQLKHGSKKFQKRVMAHDSHFTFGECLAEKHQVNGIRWQATRQPVVLDEWNNPEQPGKYFTTVMSWTSYSPLRLNGIRYGQKDIELLKLMNLPQYVKPEILQLALNIPRLYKSWSSSHGSEALTPDKTLKDNGWQIVDPASRTGTIDDYRMYIQQSKGEFSVAKEGYVVANTGWFSCRSACYLASSRPVVVEDTGFSSIIPSGRGILAFSNIDQAASAIQEISSNYRLHSLAAREMASEYFDHRLVLCELIDRAGRSQ